MSLPGRFQVTGSALVGPGLSFEVAALVDPQPEVNAPSDRRVVLAEIANSIYREGRASVLMSYDDRFDLSIAVETLRALAVVVGPLTGDRHRRTADIIARLLEDQGA